MTPHAATRLAKAEAFLAQLGKVSAEAAPAAAIHLAYYAMLHAATAVLLEKTGDAPKTHAGTIGQFSRAVLDDEQGTVIELIRWNTEVKHATSPLEG